MKGKNTYLLYNAIFPTYILMFFPPMILFSLIGNFIIDSIVCIIISLIIFKRIKGDFYKKTILKTWLLGFLADILGALVCAIPEIIGFQVDWSKISENPSAKYVFKSTQTQIPDFLLDQKFFIVIGFVVAVIFIFVFNYLITFRNKKLGLIKWQRLICALAFAILTAPFTFFLN